MHTYTYIVEQTVIFESVGMDFSFGIPLTPAGQSPRYQIIIGTASSQATYRVESSTGEIATGTAMSGSPGVHDMISTDFQVTSSEFSNRMKGIRALATGRESYLRPDSCEV